MEPLPCASMYMHIKGESLVDQNGIEGRFRRRSSSKSQWIKDLSQVLRRRAPDCLKINEIKKSLTNDQVIETIKTMIGEAGH